MFQTILLKTLLIMEILHLLQQFVKCQIVTLTQGYTLPLSTFERGELPFKNSSLSTL